MASYSYSSTAVATALAAAITSTSATSMQVPEVAGDNGWPTTFPFVLAIDYGSVGVELVTVTSKGIVGGVIPNQQRTWNISRGFDFTTASTHLAGASVRHVIAARDIRASQRLQPDDAENSYVMREITAGSEFTDSTVGDFVFKVKSGKQLLFGVDSNGFSSMYVGAAASGVSTTWQVSGGIGNGGGAIHGTNYVQVIRASVVQALILNQWNDIAFNSIATVVNDDGTIYTSPNFTGQKVGLFNAVATCSFSATGQKYLRWITQGGSVIAQTDSAAGAIMSCPVQFIGPGSYNIKLQCNPVANVNLSINSATTPTMCYFGQVA